MHRPAIRRLVFAFVACLGFVAPAGADQTLIPAVAQTIDAASLDRGATIPLLGPWQFFPGKLLEPDDFASLPALPWITPLYQRQWVDPDVQVLPTHGYGTYRLELALPPGRRDLAILPGTIGSSARIWWNGTEVCAYGRPGTDAASTRPAVSNAVHPLPGLPPGETRATLTVQVANFQDIAAGFQEIPLIGTTSTLTVHKYRTLGLFCLLAGFCFAFGLYHLFRFCFRCQDLTSLVYTAICWALSARIITGDTWPLLTLFPTIPWETGLMINYLTMTILVFGFSAFIATLFPQKHSWIVVLLAGIGSLAYSVLIVLGPIPLYMDWLPVYHWFVIALGLASIVQLIMALHQRRSGAILFTTGFFILFATAIYDIASLLMRFGSPSLSLYGIIAFTVVQALVLSRNSARLARTSERLSANLATINASQARFLPHELMEQLGKTLVTELSVGDHLQGPFSVCVIDYGFSLAPGTTAAEITQTVNAVHSMAGPIIRANGGFVTYYGANGLHAVFPTTARLALTAAHALVRAGQAGELRQGVPLRVSAAINYGNVLLGFMGEAERMNNDVISHHLIDTERLLERGKLLGASVTLGSEALKSLGVALEALQYRRLGSLRLSTGLDTAWDFFDADPPAIWREKRECRRVLTQALRAHAARRTTEAIRLYRIILKDHPQDSVARYHLGRLGIDPPSS